MQYLIIDEKLQSLSPPLSDEEFSELEESLLKNGCMSHLAVWNNILLDGHKRYNICQKHGIPYSVGYVMLDTLKDAKAWILAHHLGRKNTKTKFFHGKGTPKHRIHALSKMDAVSESLKDEKTKRELERSYFFPARESEWYHPIVDQRIIDEVAEENEKYVIIPTRFAKKLVRRYRHCLCKNYVFSRQAAEEIFNDVFGLSVAKAVKKYDPVRGAKFSTFVYSRLRYDIIREYRSHIKRFSVEHSGLDITDRAGLPTSMEVEPFFHPNDQKNPKSQAILSPTSSDKDLLFFRLLVCQVRNPEI